MEDPSLLEVRNLVTQFETEDGFFTTGPHPKKWSTCYDGEVIYNPLVNQHLATQNLKHYQIIKLHP